MSDYCISCSSTVDLSNEYMRERGIPYVCFHYEMNGLEYPDDMGKTMSPEELFRRMKNGAETKTSQVTVGEYEAFFRPILESGRDILHISFSSGLSGTFNSARLAAESMSTAYPDRRIYVVDSLAASSGYGLLVDRLKDMQEQ
ncbi:MAG: DegV family EDD domain-containing protein, partial [Lachnospiraceae bacterium]|nr:DegV family EDD domain-containing protein [Lachnospiraceae bacterium]